MLDSHDKKSKIYKIIEFQLKFFLINIFDLFNKNYNGMKIDDKSLKMFDLNKDIINKIAYITV